MGILIHNSIDDAAARNADSEAFRFEDVSLTYAELVGRANQLAHVLIERGVRPMDRVGIYMNKCIELPVALYGVLKAGSAYVPIDPSAPPARIRFILDDCGIRHVVTSASRERQAAELVNDSDPPITLIGAGKTGGESGGSNLLSWAEVAQAPATSPDAAVIESDLAYIMYTSGSTGAPKGLMHTHHSGLSYARLSARTYGVSADDRLGNHAPLHFDISTFDFLTGPYCGAATVIIPEEATMFPVSLGALIESERLTFWYSVPLALIQLVTRGAIEDRDCSSLRWVLFGGEPFPPKHLWVWEGAEGRIVDRNDRPVAAGETGELLIRAPTMMRGYWGRPDLNEQAFFLDEVVPGFVKRFYRTGDLVHLQNDGVMMFDGRRDRQIKSRGYRIELDEVENVLGSIEGVAEAAALGARAADGAMEVVAAVRLLDETVVDVTEIRTRAAERLPIYAVPAQILEMRTFPRTGSGKIDRRELTRVFEEKDSGDASETV
jgi:acyl-coenzyme A synthetase/AMP-(fatty) acid ligase